VPKEVRYRLTPRRLAANRRNLLTASASPRRASALPRRRPWACASLAALARRERQAESFQDHLNAVDRALDPDYPQDEGKLAQAIAQAAWRWIGILLDRVNQERAGLMRACAVFPQTSLRPANPLAGAQRASRLLGVFARQLWVDEAIERAALRLRRLARMFSDLRHFGTPSLLDALGEARAQGLGNPFRPAPPAIAERLSHPEKAVGDLPALPAEPPLPEPAHRAPSASTGGGALPPKPQKDADCPDFPTDYKTYLQMIRQACGEPGELQPLVDEMARLSWRRHQAACRALELACVALEQALASSRRRTNAAEFVDVLTDALAGGPVRRANTQAARLEQELAQAVRRYQEKALARHSLSDPAAPG
ncbi:MAG: hypothetical protein ACRD1J_11295, partial [Terriglobia bacterium]